jgi:4-hydroxy-2-oxoheptanedioate aldolase
VAETAVAHGKFAGTVTGGADPTEMLEMGYRFLSVGSDVVGLMQYCRGLAEAFPKGLPGAQP